MARAGATKFAALDAWLRDNGDTLDAACHGLIAPDRAVSILRTITQRATDGRCDQTLQQLATATRMSLDQVKRALHALTVVGVLLTITPARSGGRGGGKGRAPVRLISFLTVTEASTGDADGLGITQNDRAVNQEWQRSQLHPPTVLLQRITPLRITPKLLLTQNRQRVTVRGGMMHK